MLIFSDRASAGRKLAEQLIAYKDKNDVVVLGLPRGGVIPAAEVAKVLHVGLDIVCPRKIGAPFNKECAIGAITETGQWFAGSVALQELGISETYLRTEIAKETEQAQRRLELFRQGRPPRDLKGKIVILVDDGLATGLTMKAAIRTVKNEGASKVIVAVPVSPIETLRDLDELVDEVYCLSTPPFFQAVGQFYQDFKQVEDEEVIRKLKGF